MRLILTVFAIPIAIEAALMLYALIRVILIEEFMVGTE